MADRNSVLADVRRDWRTFQYAAESCRGNHAAVNQNGLTLQFASEGCLEYAAESCRGNHEIVLAAVKQNQLALQFAAASCR
eukprot:4189488-Amphidinium_carterae.1